MQISAIYPFYPIFGVFFTLLICLLYGLLRSLHDGQCLNVPWIKNKSGLELSFIFLALVFCFQMCFMISILVLVNEYPETETLVFKNGRLIWAALSELPCVENIGKNYIDSNIICGFQISFGVIFATMLFIEREKRKQMGSVQSQNKQLKKCDADILELKAQIAALRNQGVF